MCNRKLRLIDIYKQPELGGIFSDMWDDFQELFEDFQLTKEDMIPLDIYYIINHSATKAISPFLEYLLKEYVIDDFNNYVIYNNNKITYGDFVHGVDTNIINTIIKLKYYEKWKRLWNTKIANYDALSPYDMSVEDELLRDNTTFHDKGNASNTDNATQHSTTEENSTENGRYGFNSSDSVPVDKSSSEYDGTVATGSNGTSDYEKWTTRDTTNKRTISRKGNTGNITKQELLTEERKVLEWEFWEVVFKDLDSVLCRSKYIN